MTKLLVLLGAVAVVGALLVVSAFAPTSSHGCPNTGDPVGRPIASSTERTRIQNTFSPKTINTCWPGTPPGTK